MDRKEIVDTLSAAELYLSNLKNLNTEIASAEKQINNTFEETETNIKQAFSNLKNNINNILNKRELQLLDQAQKAKTDGILPLEQCRSVIFGKIESTTELLQVGQSILKGASANLVKFNKESSLLGALPEVPELKEVPYISFQSDQSNVQEVEGICSQFGDLSRIAPIQISKIYEKPGALLVKWLSVDSEEKLTDIQGFRLQRAFGDVLKSPHLVASFSDCYEGVESQFLTKDLQPNQAYSFRVSCKFEGIPLWSPWSLPQVAKTSLRPFSWALTEDFALSNENKIAKPLIDTTKVLFSDGPQFTKGHSVEFTFLEVDKSDCIIGLVSKNNIEKLQNCGEGSFLVERNGKIFVDGVEKSTVLPEFTKTLKVCFTCDLVGNHKVRIHIDSNDKRVTYDWLVDSGVKMFFAAQFFSANWKILVE